MKRLFWRFNRFMLRRHYIVQVVLFYLLTWLMTILSIPVRMLAGEVSGDSHIPHDSIFGAVILAPLVETFINQYLVFKIFQRAKSLKNRYLWYMCVSAVFFGSLHFYSLGYIIFAIGVGLVLAYIFYLYRRDVSKAFWTTVLIHVLYNAAILSHYLFVR
jgi:Type II CAAX prenyl endopeptidase Rce1-like